MIPAKINKLLDSIYKGLNEHRLNDEWLKGYRLGLRDAAVAVYQVGFDDGAKATARFQAGFLEAQKWWAERWQRYRYLDENFMSNFNTAPEQEAIMGDLNAAAARVMEVKG